MEREWLTEEEERTIEQIINRCGLANTLASISTICHGKAQHLSENWQDESAATIWTRAADILGAAVSKPAVAVASR